MSKVVKSIGLGLIISALVLFVMPKKPTAHVEPEVEYLAVSPEPSFTPVTSSKPVHIDLRTSSRIITISTQVDSRILDKANALSRLAAQSSEPIYVIINSPGGSVLDGGIFIGAMKSSRAPVYTICVQMCASMGAFIHQYGTKRYMVNNAQLMFHPASGGLQGTLEQMEERLRFIKRYVDKMGYHVARRTGLTLEQYKALVVSERWIESDDAISSKFADGIVSLDLPEPEIDLKAPFEFPDGNWKVPMVIPNNDKFKQLAGFTN